MDYSKEPCTEIFFRVGGQPALGCVTYTTNYSNSGLKEQAECFSHSHHPKCTAHPTSPGLFLCCPSILLGLGRRGGSTPGARIPVLLLFLFFLISILRVFHWNAKTKKPTAEALAKSFRLCTLTFFALQAFRSQRPMSLCFSIISRPFSMHSYISLTTTTALPSTSLVCLATRPNCPLHYLLLPAHKG